jgi:sulfotransferase
MATKKKVTVSTTASKVFHPDTKIHAKIPQEKTVHFVAGLPRSGSTVLISLLAQNPRIHGAPVSGLCGIVNGLFMNWDKIEFHREVPNEAAKRSVLKALFNAYYADIERPIVLDKERSWVVHIALLEEVLGRKVKMIIPVRPVVEILASFETLRQKNPLTYTAADEQLGASSTLETRCNYFMNATGPIGSVYNWTKDAVTSGYLDRMLFVDYNKLMTNPQKQLERIYEFLEEPLFNHDLSRIQQLVQSDDSVWRFPGLHDVRSVLARTSPDPIKTLGADLYMTYTRSEPWEQWT